MRKEGPREVEQDPLMIMRGGRERERTRDEGERERMRDEGEILRFFINYRLPLGLP